MPANSVNNNKNKKGKETKRFFECRYHFFRPGCWLVILFFCILCACKREVDNVNNENQGSQPTVSFFNLDAAVAFPVKIYINDEYMGVSNAAYMANHVPDCGKMDINLHPVPGSHKFALVANDGYYTTGNFTVSAGRCLQIQYSGINFTSINYGTNNGTLTIFLSYLGGNPVTVWVDNNIVGTLNTAPLGYRCGESRSGAVISLQLPPGQHSYKAQENTASGGTRTWTGARTIVSNQCQTLAFGL